MSFDYPRFRLNLTDIFNIKWDNLRPANRSEQNCNKYIYKNNTSGIKGVSWCSRNKKWRARITHNKKVYLVGYFSNLEEASENLILYRTKLHKEFAKHG